MKKKEFIHDLTVKQVLGVHIAHIAVIEFQKRGVPHCHILIWIENFECNCESIDRVICAEIPDRRVDEDLYQLVMDKMIHGPCNDTQSSRHYSCRENKIDGQCLRRFPKQFQSCTIFEDACFPFYRRRH